MTKHPSKRTKKKTFSCAKHSRGQGTLLSFDVAKSKPARITTKYDGTDVSIDWIVGIFVIFQNR